MSTPAKLIKKEFSQIDQEWQWTYDWLSKFTFNDKSISQITITDHYQVNHKDSITNELILAILKTKVNGENLKPTEYQGKRKVFKWEGYYSEEHYRIIFWFENNSDNWLWIRDCYPI